VGRDLIEGKSGSTVYISCAKNEAVSIFAGGEKGTLLRLHTSIESPNQLALGKDVKRKDGTMQIDVDEYRSYEILANSGDTDVLISLQVTSGSLDLYVVEFYPVRELPQSEQVFRAARF